MKTALITDIVIACREDVGREMDDAASAAAALMDEMADLMIAEASLPKIRPEWVEFARGYVKKLRRLQRELEAFGEIRREAP